LIEIEIGIGIEKTNVQHRTVRTQRRMKKQKNEYGYENISQCESPFFPVIPDLDPASQPLRKNLDAGSVSIFLSSVRKTPAGPELQDAGRIRT